MARCVCPTSYVPTEGFPRKLEVRVRSDPRFHSDGPGAFVCIDAKSSVEVRCAPPKPNAVPF